MSIANWDLTILSESLSLSLSALSIAAWLRWLQRRTVLSAVATVATTGLLLFTRTSVIPLVGLLALGVALSAIRAPARAMKLVTAAALLFTLAWGLFVMSNVEHSSAARSEHVGYLSQNFLMVLQQRILTDPETLRWFRQHGMPATTGLQPPSPRDGGFAHVLAVFAANAKLRRWAENKSRGNAHPVLPGTPGQVPAPVHSGTSGAAHPTARRPRLCADRRRPPSAPREHPHADR